VGSENFPLRLVGANFVSKTSMVFAARLAARMKFPVLLLSIAKPVYTAPEAELFTITWASVRLEVQTEMVPSRASKMNNAGDP
jgi:hypothetical protein